MASGIGLLKISANTAAALITANMIGTGVFTSLGFQLTGILHPWPYWCCGAVLLNPWFFIS